jgi:SAM-dependent methyltransferase
VTGDSIASRYETPFLRNYARSKLATDPLYAAVAERIRGTDRPVVDLGCGIGLMAAFLRERGFTAPISGIDHDAAKIERARRAVPSATFAAGDVRDPIVPLGSSVLLLDVLHYFSEADQDRILANVARADLVIIREGVRDRSMRYRATMFAEVFARITRWLKAERINFPTRERIVAAFDGFEREVVPMWGSTPFNNYLFVFRKE